MTMATDQRKRRLNSTTSAFSYGFHDQIRAKKRDLRLPNCDFNLNTHVSLKWDDSGKRVVAKDDQIGISLRHLSPFIASHTCSSNTKLADVVTVPMDLFELSDLSEVLSYEVWQSVLTEKERNFLTQFLPYGVEADEAVHALCFGDNFHFGNPLLKWGLSVCSGDYHPDAVLQHEKLFKTNKRVYYSELQQYHDNMIRNLQNLKQICAGSKDPEAEIRQFISRSKRHEKTISPDAIGQKYHKPDENVASMSELLSPIADEKICYNDNQELSVIRDAEIYKRMHNEDHIKDKHEKSILPPNGVKVLPRPKKADKLQRPILIPNDGAKYMSYVKISKKQHELVKSMRQSGSSIQSKALNRFLGGLDSSSVKPYEMFVEEEQKKIHDYWLNLSSKDIPNAFRSWRNLQLVKQKMMDSLWKEMEANLRDLSKANQYEEPAQLAPAHDKDDGESSHGTSVDHRDDDLAIQDSSSDNGDEESNLCTSKSESPSENPPLNDNEGIVPSSSVEIRPLQNPSLNVNKECDPSSPMETRSLHPLNGNEEFVPSSSMENQPLQNPSLDANKEFDSSSPMETQSLHPLNDNEEFAPSSMENQYLQNPCLSVKQQFDTPMSLVDDVNESLHHPPLKVTEELESVHRPSNASESFEPSSMKNESSVEDNTLDHKDFTPMDLNAENIAVVSEASDACSLPEQHIIRTSEISLSISHSGVCPSATDPDAAEISGSVSLKNMWSPIGLPETYHSHPTTLHTDSDGLSLRHLQVATDQPDQLIDLESDMPEEYATKDLLNRHASHLPLFNTYPSNGDRSELLHFLMKRDQEQQKKPGEFHPTNVLLESANQFPTHLQQPQFALDNLRQKAQSELFMHQNTHDGVYSGHNRYSVQAPDQFSSLNVRGWSNTHLSNPMQPSQLNSGELLNHNWFGNNGNRPGWSTSDSTVFPAQSIGSGSSTSDQSLYSVLTHCNIRSQAPYTPVGSTELMIPPANYGQERRGGIPMTNNALLPPVSPFDYLSGGEASSTTVKNPNLGWMSLGHQPSGLQDPSGKPFLKSWNQ